MINAVNASTLPAGVHPTLHEQYDESPLTYAELRRLLVMSGALDERDALRMDRVRRAA
jgi:hypothetical protein